MVPATQKELPLFCHFFKEQTSAFFLPQGILGKTDLVFNGSCLLFGRVDMIPNKKPPQLGAPVETARVNDGRVLSQGNPTMEVPFGFPLKLGPPDLKGWKK